MPAKPVNAPVVVTGQMATRQTVDVVVAALPAAVTPQQPVAPEVPVSGASPAASDTSPVPALFAPLNPAPVVGALRWRWPSQGPLIGRFVPGDQTQQGINIAGSAGQPVLAASEGIVVYSGSGLVGYGELIIIKHSNEWLSAYAHNRRRLVAEGANVAAGQVIAEMGRTGAVRDMLHFEIRQNGRPVDPLILLPAH